MKVKIANGGNSLAVCLPATGVREAGLAAGDDLGPTIDAAEGLTRRLRRTFDLAAFWAETDGPRASRPGRPQLPLR